MVAEIYPYNYSISCFPHFLPQHRYIYHICDILQLCLQVHCFILPNIIVDCNVDMLRHCVFTFTKSISTNSLLNCFFCPPIAFTLLVRRGTASNVRQKLAPALCLQRQHVACACNEGYNCALSATSPSCVRDSGARVSLTSALSSNLLPHRLLASLKLGTIRLIVCIKECTIEQP